MFVGKAESVVEVCVVENDVTMRVGLVCVDGKHILIVALQETVAQFLTNLQGLFGCHLIGCKTLDYVVCEDFGAPCALLSDGSEVGSCTDAVGSASKRLDI